MKKKGLFSSQKASNQPLARVPWIEIQNALFMLPVGEKIPIPTRRSEYEQIRNDLSLKSDPTSKNSVEFIDFIFKHEELGNVEFLPELN